MNICVHIVKLMVSRNDCFYVEWVLPKKNLRFFLRMFEIQAFVPVENILLRQPQSSLYRYAISW